MTPPLLEARQLVKSFPGVRALKGVNLTLARGEVLAVIGENGAGKSTLMKILAGVQTPDSGQLFIDGKPCVIGSVEDAMEHGIRLIHQELNLARTLDVGANIFLGREPSRWGWMDQARIARESALILARVGLNVPPSTPLSALTIGQQQLIEIAKALSIRARVLIMDEPTSSLSVHETEALVRLIKELRSSGVSIVYISHRLGEVEAVADRVEVLRDGENAGTIPRPQIQRDTMVKLMVGRDLSQFYPHQPHPPGAVAMETREIRTALYPKQSVSFNVRAGEIVGLAGLVGAGRTELLEAIFGVVPALSGSVELGSLTLRPQSPVESISAGLALVPEDRKHHGLALEMGVRENLSLANLHRDQRFGFRDGHRENALCETMIAALRIKTPGPSQPVQFLSGGNQQKVVIGKWLATDPRVLLLDEPTRGIDIGAKQEIYRLMEELAARGVAIVFASSEMEEILGMSDRVLVMHEGRITGELPRQLLSEESIMGLATGGGPAPLSSQ